MIHSLIPPTSKHAAFKPKQSPSTLEHHPESRPATMFSLTSRVFSSCQSQTRADGLRASDRTGSTGLGV